MIAPFLSPAHRERVYVGRGYDRLPIENIFPFDDEIITPARDNDKKLKYINVRKVSSKTQKKFSTSLNDYTVSAKRNSQLEQNVDELKDMVTLVLEEMIRFAKREQNFRRGDKLNLVVQNPQFWESVSTGYMDGSDDENIINRLIEKIVAIMTSDESVKLEACKFNVQVTNVPRSSARSKILNVSKDLKTKMCVIQILNDDTICLFRSVIVGLTFIEPVCIMGRTLSKNEITYVRKGRKLQAELANELRVALGLPVSAEGYTLEHVQND